MISKLFLAVKRCRVYVSAIFAIYCLSCFTGIMMVHNGSSYALSYRDKLVGRAQKTDKAAINYAKGKHFSAALADFSENLVLGAVPQTLAGFSIVIPFFTVAVQGWVGGIVSVDDKHQSRLAKFKPACYYFLVLLLQFIPYSLAIGAGVKCGVDFYNHNKIQGWYVWKFRIQKASLADLGYVYLFVIPLFFIASCFEFFSTWNI
ncbi:MAG TPA: hypothetical protein VFE53_23440 [Mucilaginibacter sp.]|nr:hypothetical protein [Mucilaginibacter sp.]